MAAAANLKTTMSLDDKNFSAKLDSTIKKALGSLKNMLGSVKGLGGVLGNLGGQMGGLIGNISGLSGAFSALANPITAAGVAVGAAAVAFFNYNKHLEETLRLTKQFTGLDGSLLSSLTNGILALADSTGKEYDEMLHAVEEHAKTFGITFEQALQNILAGFVAGADENGNFLDSLKLYGPVFKDLGVLGDELVAVLSLTRNGLFNDEGMAAIQMASKNIGNMTSKTKEDLAAIGIDADAMIQKVQSGSMSGFLAVQLIAQKMKETGRSTLEYGAVLQDVFGKKGTALGSPFVDTLAEMSTNLEEVKGQTGELGQVMDDLINTTREWNNACETLFGAVGSGFADFGKKAKTYVLQNLTKIINHIVDLYNKSMLVRGAVLFIMLLLKGLYLVAKAVFLEMGQLVKNLAKAIEHLLEGEFSLAWDDVGNIAADDERITKALKEGLSEAWDHAKKETLDGKIEKVTIDADVNTNTNTTGGGGGGNDDKKPKPPKGKGGKNTPAPEKDTKDEPKDEPKENSINWLQNKISELNKAWKNGTYEGTIEEWKKDVEKYLKILDEKLAEMGEGAAKIDPKSYEGLGQKINEYKQKYAQGLLDISPEEYEKTLKSMEAEQHNLGVKLKIIADDTDINKEIDEILKEPEISSFELYVKPVLDTSDEAKLQRILERMNRNDEQLASLDELKKALDKLRDEYGKLSDAGQLAYIRILAAQLALNAENEKLGKMGAETNAAIEKSNKLKDNFNNAANAVGSLGDAFSSLGSSFESPELNIAGTIAQAIAQTALGFGQALTQEAKGGIWYWIAAGAAGMAQLIALISLLHSLTGYASGGIVGGGKQVGDKNLVRVNSGEIILNLGQQTRLWNMINGNTSFGDSNTGTRDVHFVLRGADLYGSFNNYKKITKK